MDGKSFMREFDSKIAAVRQGNRLLGYLSVHADELPWKCGRVRGVGIGAEMVFARRDVDCGSGWCYEDRFDNVIDAAEIELTSSRVRLVWGEVAIVVAFSC